MDKYELRRQKLTQIRDEMCNGKAVELAARIDRAPSYVSRMLYPEGKKGKKRIADDMVELVETAFSLPRGWMDGIAPDNTAATGEGSWKNELTPRQRILLELIDELPDSEADELLKTLEEKKQYYEMIYREIKEKKSKRAS